VLAAPDEEASQGLRRALVEILRQLNRDEMEEPDVPGLELDELRQLLARRSFPLVTRDETDRAVGLLVRNGLACELTEPRYAWTRGRTVQHRVTITAPGKAFLRQAIQRVGRV
jgi:hypothetical protein